MYEVEEVEVKQCIVEAEEGGWEGGVIALEATGILT